MNKNKVLGIMFGIIYYVCGIFGFYIFDFFMLFHGYIINFSTALFIICYMVLPIILLLLPIIIKKITRKEFYKSILLSLIGVVIYFIVLYAISFDIRLYMSKFTTRKWTNTRHSSLRYLMIDDLEKKYDLVGMKKNEVIKLLGSETEADVTDFDNGKSICYFIKSSGFGYHQTYCLSYDENGIVTETSKNEVD